MKKTQWVFPAISFLLLASLWLSESKTTGLILLCLWILRIYLLGDNRLLIRVLCFTGVFSAVILTHVHQNQTDLTGEESIFMLALDRNSFKIDGDYLSVVGKTKKMGEQEEKIALQYYISSFEEKEYWENNPPPAFLIVEGELVRPKQQTNFNQFDYRKYLKRQKIHWQFKANQIQTISSNKVKMNRMQKIATLRFRILKYFDTHFHEKIASYLKILFIGEKQGLAENTRESYRALGLIHLFSISGFHISYLSNLLERFFLRSGISKERTNILLFFILPAYALITGLSISIFRAVAQKIIRISSVVFNLEIDSLDAWALALMFYLLINPYAVFELSFQLSYSLSALFILLGKREWIQNLNFIQQSLLFSSVSSLVSLPILSYHFYELSWLTILSNIFFLPFFSYCLFPMLFMLLLISPLFSKTTFFIYFNKIAAKLFIYLEIFLLNLTKQYNFTFIIGRLPYVIMIILVISIFSFIKKVESKRFPSLIIILFISLSIKWHSWSPISYVLMIDVGQGDSILIKEAHTGKITLIDTGGKIEWQEKEAWQQREKEFSLGKDVVASTLKSLGIAKIDRLYISHAHADHMGEIHSLADEIQIKEIVATPATINDESFQKQIQGMEETCLSVVEAEQRLAYPTSDTFALHPLVTYPDKNNQSLVLYVKIAEDWWLFTGDIEVEGEQDLINAYPSLKVDYLKVAHHGSSTSSTEDFIACTRPEMAFISVGNKNKYGHPDPEVINRLEENNIQYYLTAEDGAIKMNYFKAPFMNQWFKKIEKVNQN